MAFTYADTLPTDKDRVRHDLGDVDITQPLVTDEHIYAVLDEKGSVAAAVAYIAYGLVARFANDPVKWTADGESFDYSNRIGIWRDLATRSTTAAQPNGGAGLSFVSATFGRVTTTDEYGRSW